MHVATDADAQCRRGRDGQCNDNTHTRCVQQLSVIWPHGTSDGVHKDYMVSGSRTTNMPNVTEKISIISATNMLCNMPINPKQRFVIYVIFYRTLYCRNACQQTSFIEYGPRHCLHRVLNEVCFRVDMELAVGKTWVRKSNGRQSISVNTQICQDALTSVSSSS